MPHNPTRFPYGISYVKPGVAATEYTFTAGDATPDVSYGTFFINASSALTITNFDGGERGKVIYLHANSGNAVTIQNSAGGIRLTNIVGVMSSGLLTTPTTAGNLVMLNNETLHFAHDGTDWSMVGTRFVLSTQV